MKKLILMAALFTSIMSYGQSTIRMIYKKDAFTDKESLTADRDLIVSDDGKKGFVLYPSFAKSDNKWKYLYIAGKSTVGDCFEGDIVYFIFDDGSKFQMTSWIDFNCKGYIGFDLHGKYLPRLSKPIKAIRIVNARTYQSYEKTFTNDEDKNYFIDVFNALDEYNKHNGTL